jgi:hypothetical protein
MALVSLAPHLTPHGRLPLVRDNDASLLEAELAHRIQNAFGRGAGHGLLYLGANEVASLCRRRYPSGGNLQRCM